MGFIWLDRTFLVTQTVKGLPAMRETQVQSPGWGDPLEQEMATHSSTLAWKIPWTEEPGRLQSMGPQSWTWLSDFTSLHFTSCGWIGKGLILYGTFLLEVEGKGWTFPIRKPVTEPWCVFVYLKAMLSSASRRFYKCIHLFMNRSTKMENVLVDLGEAAGLFKVCIYCWGANC